MQRQTATQTRGVGFPKLAAAALLLIGYALVLWDQKISFSAAPEPACTNCYSIVNTTTGLYFVDRNEKLLYFITKCSRCSSKYSLCRNSKIPADESLSDLPFSWSVSRIEQTPYGAFGRGDVFSCKQIPLKRRQKKSKFVDNLIESYEGSTTLIFDADFMHKDAKTPWRPRKENTYVKQESGDQVY